MQNAARSVTNYLWHFIKKQKAGFLLMQLFALAWALEATLWPYVLMLLIDTLQEYQGPREEIWPAIKGVIYGGLALWILLEASFRLHGIYRMLVAPRFEANIRMTMYDFVNSHSYAFFANNFTGTIANKISDLPRSVWAMMDIIITTFVPTAVALIISVAFFSKISPLFALILSSWVVMHILICYFYSKSCSYFSKIHSESRSKLLGRIVDTLTNNLNVRLFSRKSYEYQYTMKFQEEEIKRYSQSIWYVEKLRIILGVVCLLVTGVLMTWYEVYCFKKGIIDLSELIFIINTTFQITMLVSFAGIMVPDFFNEVGICKQALSIVNTPIDIKDAPNAKELKVAKGEITFENVTFNYEFNTNVFKNRSITIPAGQKVGLVGASGSGKTTFANLILRFYEISGGRILIDGQDIRSITQESLRRQISMISQEPMLFHRSVMENIRYGNLNATDEEVIEAAKVANCHHFIMSLPEGYRTTTGERGLKLSGGQKQRISIARAVLKNAPILILDEATSALDSVTEKSIQESLHQIMHGRTTLVIAHRLSTLVDMDRILVFKKGDIVEDGSHEELIARKGEYYKLWSLQSDGFLPESVDE
jgi:ATP-binding cassette subfamily B protein